MAVVRGDSSNHNEPAVIGVSTADGEGMGVFGQADEGSGVLGMSTDWHGVYGHSVHEHAVVGEADEGAGVVGRGKKWFGVYGHSENEVGVYGESDQFEGVRGVSHSGNHAGVVAINETGGVALYAKSPSAARSCAFFDGNIEVKYNSGIRLNNWLLDAALIEGIMNRLSKLENPR
jgi:hypothetical protein